MSWVSQGRPVPMPAASTKQTGLLELSLLLRLPRAGGLFSLQPRISGCPRYLNFTPGQMRDSQPSSTAGPHSQNLPKIRFPKFVKLTDYTYAFNSLITFKYEAQSRIGNGNFVNLLKLALKNSWKQFKQIYFWRDFAFWPNCASVTQNCSLSVSLGSLDTLSSTAWTQQASSAGHRAEEQTLTAAPLQRPAAPAICTVISQIFFFNSKFGGKVRCRVKSRAK